MRKPTVLGYPRANRNQLANKRAWKKMTPCERITGKPAEYWENWHRQQRGKAA